MDREAKLAAALEEVVSAAATQLSGIGRGKEPSDRLAAAFDVAADLLGFDPITKNDRHAGLKAEAERLRAELAERGIDV